MKKVSVVIPMYNEEEVANKSYTKIKDILENLKQYERFNFKYIAKNCKRK